MILTKLPNWLSSLFTFNSSATWLSNKIFQLTWHYLLLPRKDKSYLELPSTMLPILCWFVQSYLDNSSWFVIALSVLHCLYFRSCFPRLCIPPGPLDVMRSDVVEGDTLHCRRKSRFSGGKATWGCEMHDISMQISFITFPVEVGGLERLNLLHEVSGVSLAHLWNLGSVTHGLIVYSSLCGRLLDGGARKFS